MSPDYFMPATSSIIQGRLKLNQDMVCLDMNLACSGFVVGLIQAFMLLEQESIRKVVLINGDVLSRKTSPKDRNIYPLVGDAASITILERDPEDSDALIPGDCGFGRHWGQQLAGQRPSPYGRHGHLQFRAGGSAAAH
jgi:3-oxoacyl-[acyl-carrier-protein] synthase III